MNIFDYYLNQQKYKEWYTKFQSTASDKSGKIFSFTSTNYRNILNFLKDLDKFKRNNGIPRDEFEKYSKNGQDVDKQRIVPLTNAHIIEKNMNRYLLTNIGWTCIDINNGNFTDNEKWILIYIILLDYEYDGRKNDLIQTSKNYIKYMIDAGLDENYILNSIFEMLTMRNKDYSDIFSKDIFWYITFAKDRKFITIFSNSSEEEKEMLKNYVIKEQKNKKSKDCIGHKFVSSGAMNKSTFLEECEILYYTYIISKEKYKNLELFLERLLILYMQLHNEIDKEKIKKFIEGHKSIYDYIFSRTNLKEESNNE